MFRRKRVALLFGLPSFAFIYIRKRIIMSYTSSHTGQEIDDAVDAVISKESTWDSKAEVSDITDAINALDVSDAAVAGKYISAVSEVNGKIQVTRADLPQGGSSQWGDITGTLADQTDLKSALDAKATPADITAAINNLNKSGSPHTNQYISVVRQSNGLVETQSATLPMHTAGNGISVTSGTVSAKLGSGLSFDANGAIQATGGGGGGAAWGSITGTLSSQTDLQSALNAKANSGDIPTKVSDLTNDSGFQTSAQVGAAVTDAINNLDVADSAVAGKYVSAVSESNGVITVTRADLPSGSATWGSITGDIYSQSDLAMELGTKVSATSIIDTYHGGTGIVASSRSAACNTLLSDLGTYDSGINTVDGDSLAVIKPTSVDGGGTPYYKQMSLSDIVSVLKLVTGSTAGVKIAKVASVPASPDPDTIYLVQE